MAYISPNTELRIYSGVPLDRNYNHTVKQDSLSTQLTVFAPYLKYTLTNLSYQRSGKDTIRVSKLADTLYDCNYMAFQNTAFGNKWFYAFIDHVEYINNNTSEITYTIDVMQTWYFDYTLGECYVEREHSETDGLGDNLVPEDLDTGELVVNQKSEYMFPRQAGGVSIYPLYYFVIFYVPNNDKGYITAEEKMSGTGLGVDTWAYTITPCKTKTEEYPYTYTSYDTGVIVNDIYMGCKYWGVPLDTSTTANITTTRRHIDSLINEILGANVGGSIVNCMQVPTNVWLNWTTNSPSTETDETMAFTYTTAFKDSRGIYMYYPKNMKMYTSPYRCMVVSNNSGQTATYKWECSGTTIGAENRRSITLRFQGIPVPTPEVMCYPRHYRSLDRDFESGLILSDFPKPPWSEDSFSKWWTQNGDAYITSVLTSAVTSIAGIFTAPTNTATAIATIGGAVGIANSIGRYTTAKNTPDQISGQTNISSLRTVQNRIGFTIYDMGVEYSLAKVIDSYFTMFGYAVKQLKVPNIKNPNAKLRPHWNYVKTLSCVIHSEAGKGLPAEDEEAIAKIYDNGITFWSTLGNIGDYSLDNSPQEVTT